MAAYPIQTFQSNNMFNLKEVFEKKFDGTGVLQWYQPTFEGVAMAEKLYDILTGVEECLMVL
ncbi:hypothetical protein PQX77_016780 [Marasmius sp. AFHP31]|nr:hypothetical protein PQX77_016780 [Marasmius sp. AFHP31]